jgi:hypothetical protein
LVYFWKIGAMYKKIHIKRHPQALPLLFRGQNHFRHFALRPTLFAPHRVGVDIHGDVAVGVAHQRLHSLHILIILSMLQRYRSVSPTAFTDWPSFEDAGLSWTSTSRVSDKDWIKCRPAAVGLACGYVHDEANT